MSVMSTGQAGFKTAVGAEFMAAGPWAAGSAPCPAAGLAADGRSCQEAAAKERGERDLRITELYFRQLHVREVRSVRQGAQRHGTAGTRARQVRAVAALPAAGRPGPVRLTRRGRLVVAGLTILATMAVAMVLWLSLAGGAQASSHGQPARAGYRGMTQVVVRPGQTLWSIASSAQPSADPRLVIQQITDANALGGASIRAGQLLWVPKS
jgi:hypothetical protein